MVFMRKKTPPSPKVELDPEVRQQAEATLRDNKVAIFIVAYNAENHIEKVLQRIPDWVAAQVSEIFVIDDHSKDATVQVIQNYKWSEAHAPLRVYRTPYNQGYGGNQRLGYLYSIARGFDIVVLLHGDGQYAPEALPHILAPYSLPQTDAVYGSRFMPSWHALKGGMPLYKFVGNRILTRLQNLILGTRLSEMHSGYRSYRISALKKVPFQHNSKDFDFDADIIVQLHAAQLKLVEVPIPTYYGDEISRVNGIRYAINCIRTFAKYRMMQFEIFYDRKFDIRSKPSEHYQLKQASNSIHQYVQKLEFDSSDRFLDVGGANGYVSRRFAEAGAHVTCIDINPDRHFDHPNLRHIAVDMDTDWGAQLPHSESQFSKVLALDVIEHFRNAELGTREIYNRMLTGGKLYASTGNVSFLIVRFMLMFGQFNYGRRGILDLDHKRLFTVKTFQHLLETEGFQVDRVRGFGPPLADMVRREDGSVPFLGKALDRILGWLAYWFPSSCSFQFLVEATRLDSPVDLIDTMVPEMKAEQGAADRKRLGDHLQLGKYEMSFEASP